MGVKVYVVKYAAKEKQIFFSNSSNSSRLRKKELTLTETWLKFELAKRATHCLHTYL